ncbi:hypothetical protein [Marivita sp.]|uniref:hypothetical protein n=1 Tax=Marivita sp. TaxID=2003365 RepID=UPI0025BBD033|nr:hypothetical protein [Marivita sp.]
MALTIACGENLDDFLDLVRAFFAWTITKVWETSGQPALDSALVSFVQPNGGYRIGATFRILMAA